MKRSFPRLTWQPPARYKRDVVLETAATAAPAEVEVSALRRLVDRFGEPRPEVAMSPRETAIYFLQIAAEVEQALLAQYLFALYSIDRNAAAPVSTWPSKLRQIAREEMGHLVTLQNLLMSIGAQPYLRRSRTPAPELYPFPLHLEPLSLTSIRKYIVAESPADADLPATEFPADVNRVGIIYAKLYSLFQKDDTPAGPLRIERGTFSDEHLADSDFVEPGSLKDRFATADEWSKEDDRIYVLPKDDPADIPAMRTAACEAIHLIAAQGEGPSTEIESHFARLMSIHKDMVASQTNGVLSIAVNPKAETMTNETARLWATLSDVRYEVLIREIEHALSIPRRPQLGADDPRAQLIEWAVRSSNNEMSGVMRPIASKLTTLFTGNASGERAGMPLREPETDLPAVESDRWKQHRALLRKSSDLAQSIGNDAALQRMRMLDQQRLPFIETQIGDEHIMAKKYRIHPAIGLARIGDSENAFFLCPEAVGTPPHEIAADGSETALQQYKDAEFRIKRQAARFRVFEYDDDGTGNLTNPREITAADARIEWKVTLANTKAAARRSPPPTASQPPRNEDITDRASLAITPKEQTIAGASQGPVPFDDGAFKTERVYLGELRTDAAGRLLVLGGRGKSASVPPGEPILGFTDNDHWYDDVGDGPVTATIAFDGQEPIQLGPESSAWVIVAPPDFAPSIGGMVTMYDIAIQAAETRGWITPPAQPSFRRDILPVVYRASLLRWVHTFNYWDAIPRDYAALSNPATPRVVRENAFDLIRNNPLNGLQLTAIQERQFEQWVGGNFIDDFAQAPAARPMPEELDHAALDVCVGGGFFPGIEMGEFMTEPDRYVGPFRLTHAMHAGEMTERMAIPWQADFWDCREDWWPSQRPDTVLARVDDAIPPAATWSDPVASYEDMVAKFRLLGFVRPATNAAGEDVFVETERDPSIARP